RGSAKSRNEPVAAGQYLDRICSPALANLTVPLSLALTDSQLLPMLLSFAAMFAFAGIAVWLWLRQRHAPRSQPSKIVPPKPAPAQNREPERSEPPEFVALPGQREEDSPDPAAGERTEFVPPPSELTAHVDAVHEQ